MCWLVVIFMVRSVRAESYYDNVLEYVYPYRRAAPTKPNYDVNFFSSLENYAVNAIPVSESKYPWIARVVHSRTQGYPYMCTAVCVDARIFITAARCVYILKVAYTSVIYQQRHFSVIAFVVPSNVSKQLFDDIGFVVVNEDGYKGQWHVAKLFDTSNRTDENFNWFEHIKFPTDHPTNHVAVGYAAEKSDKQKYLSDEKQHKLSELEVFLNINICPEILVYRHILPGFHVPCYHSCSVEQFKVSDSKCSNYHGALGAAVFNVKTQKLLGIVTWGATTYLKELPVGFSVPNSSNFFKDFTCARRIKLDKGSIIIDGYYQALCEDIQ